MKDYGATGRVPVLFREKFPDQRIEAIQLGIRCRGYRDSVENIRKLVDGLKDILTDTSQEGLQDYFTRERKAPLLVELDINTRRVENRFRQNVGDLTLLMESIKGIGLLHPIVVTSDGRLIAGQRRLEACRQLGWPRILARVLGLVSAAQAEHDENVERMDFSPVESLRICDFLEDEYKTKALERKGDAGREAGKKGGLGTARKRVVPSWRNPFTSEAGTKPQP